MYFRVALSPLIYVSGYHQAKHHLNFSFVFFFYQTSLLLTYNLPFIPLVMTEDQRQPQRTVEGEVGGMRQTIGDARLFPDSPAI